MRRRSFMPLYLFSGGHESNYRHCICCQIESGRRYATMTNLGLNIKHSKEVQLVWRVLFLLLNFLALNTFAFSYENEETLEAYWPTHAPQKSWRIIASSEKDAAKPNTIMSIANRNTGTTQFELWFSNKPGQPSGSSDVELYEYCSNPGGQPWLFLDSYINAVDGTRERFHPVTSTRILFTPDKEDPLDLIADGTYAKCGNKGQPYLLWKQNLDSYRIQVWGFLAENPKWKWYWDATVTKAAPVTNNCLQQPQSVKAIRVQEAWWNNFKEPAGHWDLGRGDTSVDGLPNGASVRYGRTVWHAQGQIPYFLIGKPDGRAANQCVKEVNSGNTPER
jgi:hypothetical protein